MIRDYASTDFPQVAALHEMRNGGRDFFPDPRYAINGAAQVVAEENGRVVAAAIGRRTLEAFLLISPEYDGVVRRARLIASLLKEGAARARKLGYGEFHMPTDDERFHKFLLSLPGVHDDRRYNAWYDLVRTA